MYVSFTAFDLLDRRKRLPPVPPPPPTPTPGSRKNRNLLFYALKKTRALLFCTQHEKPRLDHAAVLYCAICPDTVMEDRSYSGSSNVIKQSKCALTRTECCFFAVFESVEGATRWRKSGWCLFHQRPLCRWHRAASSSKLPFVIGRRFEKVSLFIVYLPFNGKIGLNTLYVNAPGLLLLNPGIGLLVYNF